MSEKRFNEQTHIWRERRIQTAFRQPAGLGHGWARRSLFAQSIDG